MKINWPVWIIGTVISFLINHFALGFGLGVSFWGAALGGWLVQLWNNI